MSVKGFLVNGTTQRYDYGSLDNNTIEGSVNNIENELSILGNWGKYTVGTGTYYIPFTFVSGHTYVIQNLSASGSLNFNLRLTKDGENVQSVYGLNAGTTNEFIANQDAAWINGWQSVSQAFIITDKSSDIVKWNKYEQDINDICQLKIPITLIAGGYDNVGSISPNVYYSYTDFIDVSGTDKIRIISPDNPLNYCAWYQEDKITGTRFTVQAGDTIKEVPSGYKYCRLSSTTTIMKNVSVYGAIYFKGYNTEQYVESIKTYLPNRLVGSRATSGMIDYPDYQLISGHSYLIINPNNFACSFSPLDSNGDDSALGSTTVNANSSGIRVVESNGYPRLWFEGNDGILYIYDLDEEPIYKGIVDQNNEAVNAIQSSRYKASATPHLLSLLHFSDLHADYNSLRRIIRFKNAMADYIEDTICTGDIASSKYGDGINFWANSNGAEDILTCVGNHDSYYTNSMDEQELVPMATIASTYIDPFESNWGTITRPSNCTYYYKDYASGYRLIVLDSIRIGAEANAEATWLESVLADAKTNNLAVIIATHYMPTGGMYIYDCGFSKYGTSGSNKNICNKPSFDVEELVQAFIDGGGQFMCYLIGHLHRDIFGYVNGYPDQLCIMVTTSSIVQGQQNMSADLNRVIGKKSQDAFNVVTFDKDSGIVKVIRVGADVDNMMRPRKIISYNVATKTIIGSDDVADLKSTIGDDTLSLSPGYIDNIGGIVEQAELQKEVYSQMLPIRPGSQLTFAYDLDGFTLPYMEWVTFAYYDHSGQFLFRETATAQNTLPVTKTSTVPTNCFFFRVTFRTFGGTIKYANLTYDYTIKEWLGDSEYTLNTIEDEISRINNHELSASFSASGNMWFKYRITAGHTYVINNTSADYAVIVDATNANNSYTSLQTLAWEGPYETTTVEATTDAEWIKVYSNGTGTFTIYDLCSLVKLRQAVVSLPKMSERLASRQGQGYSFPDNSIEGITAALNDGYKKIRIGVASTSDSVIYCTHVYELEHNAETNVLSIDGTPYTQNVDITASTSEFIDTLSYKGYAIPKLDDVMKIIAQYNAEVTLEIKQTVTTQFANNLIDTVLYYAVPYVISGLTTQIYPIVAINENLNIGVIFHLTNTELITILSNLNGKYKSFRVDAFYEDTITKADVIDLHKRGIKLKLGGSNITLAAAKEYLWYVDVVEYQKQISEFLL